MVDQNKIKCGNEYKNHDNFNFNKKCSKKIIIQYFCDHVSDCDMVYDYATFYYRVPICCIRIN